MHLTLGILRQSQAFFYALAFFWLDGFAVPAPAQVTQAVGRLAQKEKQCKCCQKKLSAIGTAVIVGATLAIGEHEFTISAMNKAMKIILDFILPSIFLLIIHDVFMASAPNGLRYLRWGGDGEAVQPEKCSGVENCLGCAQNPQRQVHALLGAFFTLPDFYR